VRDFVDDPHVQRRYVDRAKMKGSGLTDEPPPWLIDRNTGRPSARAWVHQRDSLFDRDVGDVSYMNFLI
jgi:hypothetical protein